MAKLIEFEDIQIRKPRGYQLEKANQKGEGKVHIQFKIKGEPKHGSVELTLPKTLMTALFLGEANRHSYNEKPTYHSTVVEDGQVFVDGKPMANLDDLCELIDAAKVVHSGKPLDVEDYEEDDEEEDDE